MFYAIMMDENINISVIIPHYQSTEVLKKCLDSIPINKEIEVIVIDDHSPDETSFKKVKDLFPTFIFLRLGHNKGAGAARNKGLELAKGKWLLFADADDYFLPNAFDIFKTYSENNADIIFFKTKGWNYIINKESNRYYKYCICIDDFISNKKNAEDRLRYQWYGPCAKMIRKSLVDEHKISFDETKYSNDVMFSVKTGYYARTIDVCTNEVYCITEIPNSLTKKFSYNSIMCRYEVMCRYNRFLKDIGKPNNQAVVLRFYLLAIKYAPSCIVPMIKLSKKYKINPFAGLNKLFGI